MAFITSTPFGLARRPDQFTSSSSSSSSLLCLSDNNVITRHNQQATIKKTTIKSQQEQEMPIEREIVKEGQPFDINKVGGMVLSEVRNIPSKRVFYSSATVLFVASILLLTLSSSLISSLDQFPFIPDTLRLVSFRSYLIFNFFFVLGLMRIGF